MIAPGETIGILGGGQLGRMIALAAAQLGYRCHIYAPEADAIGADVAAAFTQGRFDDTDKLAEFAATCAVVTYEFENVAAAPLAAIEGHAPLHPPARRAFGGAGPRERETVCRRPGRASGAVGQCRYARPICMPRW